MSHISEIDLAITDVPALIVAGRQCGMEFLRDVKTCRYYDGQREPCDHVLRVIGNDQAYEIGVVKRTDGKPGYKLLTDFYDGGRGLEEKVGINAGKLKQRYSIEIFRREMAKKGMRITERVVNGKLRVEAR